MALTPKWTLCMGKEFIHRLAGHTVKPLLCDVSCGGFPDSRHIVNTQLQSLIWPVCRCKQKATLESKEKAFRTLSKITAPLDRQRSSLSNTFSCCAENHQAEFFCTGTLHRTKPTVDVVRARTGAVVLQGCLPWIQECTSCPQQHSFQPLCLRNLQYSAVQRQDYFIWALKIPHEPHWYGVQHTVTNDLQRFCPSCSTPDAARLRRGGSLSSEAPPVFSVAGTWEVRSGRLVYCSSGLLFAVLKYLNSQEAAVT